MIKLNQATQNVSTQAEKLWVEIAEGLLYTHSRLNTNTSKTLEASAFLYALVELLSEKGLITIDELDERKQAVGQRLLEQFRQSENGVMLQEPEYDKYAFPHGAQIDCEKRVHLCKASCCRLPFALRNRTFARASCIGIWASPI